MHKKFRPAAFLAACLAMPMSGCGGGSDAVEPAVANEKNEVYLGFYAEDAINNPEDPMTGAFVLTLPKGDASFSGSMYFTHVGCQSASVGTISGAKSSRDLSGSWTGVLDGLAQAGKFSGGFVANLGGYAGGYTNDGGKQYRDLRPCVEHFIAALGRWEAYPEGISTPVSFAVSVAGRSVSWTGSPDATTGLLYLIDATLADGARNPVVLQSAVSPAGGALTLPDSVPLTPGREYIVAVGLIKQHDQRVAFGSKRFTAP